MDNCDSHGRSSCIGWKNEMTDEHRAHSVLLFMYKVVAQDLK